MANNKVKDFPLHTQVIIKKNLNGVESIAFDLKNVYCVICSPVYDNTLESGNTNALMYMSIIGNQNVRNGSFGGIKITSAMYNNTYVKNGKPTLQEFLDFYEDCYVVNTIFQQTPYGGKNSIVYLTCDAPIGVQAFDGNYEGEVEKQGYFSLMYDYSLPALGGYTSRFPLAFSFSYNGQPTMNDAVLFKKQVDTVIKHTFYINGGTLGGRDNYSITEVVSYEGDDEPKYSFQTSEKSTLMLSFSEIYTTTQDTTYLDSTYQSLVGKVRDDNGLTQAKLNLLIPQQNQIRISHKPQYVKKDDGQTAFGTEYTFYLYRKLPDKAEDVNNVWASVTRGDERPTNNVVEIVYGEPPKQEPTGEETTDNTSHNNGGIIKPSGDEKTPSSYEVHYGSDTGGATEVTHIYELSSQQLKLFGQNLWSQNYFNVLKIQINPIENVISIKKFPFSIGGTSTPVKIGDVTLGCNGDVITKGVHTIDFGKKLFGGSFGSYLDYEPFTTAKLYLPYIGVFDLPINEIMGRYIGIIYKIDLIQGDCMAIVTVRFEDKDVPLYEFNGNMGISVPVTQTDRVQAEMQRGLQVVGGGLQMFGGDIGGGALSIASGGIDNTSRSSHTASSSGSINVSACQDVKIIISRPQSVRIGNNGFPSGFGHTHGYQYNDYSSISELTGFFKCGQNVDLSGITATQEVKNKIAELLRQGVYK